MLCLSLFIFSFLNVVNGLAPKNVIQNPFKNEETERKRADESTKTIYGEFIIFFNEDCLEERDESHRDIIKEFLDKFECYKPKRGRHKKKHKRHGDDYWVMVNRIEDCYDNDEKEIDFSEYCITQIDENAQFNPFTAVCAVRFVEDSLHNLENVSENPLNAALEYIHFESSDPELNIIVMDTGIDNAHSEFDGISFQRLFDAYPGSNPTDFYDHGTHVAATIIGKTYGMVEGTSSNVHLYDVKWSDNNGDTTWANLYAALDEIVDFLVNKKAIINHSWRGGGNDEVDDRIATIRNNGGINICAAGNDNNDANNWSPARSPDCITVGAMDENNAKAWFSNFGDVVDTWAYGTNIKSALPNNGNGLKDGTSMAAPLVAGVVANIFAFNSILDFDNIKNALLSGAIYDFNDGNGRAYLPRTRASCSVYEQVLPTTDIGAYAVYLRLQNKQSGNCIYQNSGGFGYADCSFNQDQYWKLDGESGGYFRLKNKESDECIVNRAGDDYSESPDSWFFTYVTCLNYDDQFYEVYYTDAMANNFQFRNKQTGLGIYQNSDGRFGIVGWNPSYIDQYWRVLLDEYTRLRSYNLNNYVWTHFDGSGTRINSNPSPRANSQFRIVPGLADSQYISFESVNNIGYYLRHQNSALKLNAYENIDYDELIESNQLLDIDDESSKMDKLHNDAVNAARSIMKSIIDEFDRQLIEYCISQGRGVVLVINKWDKITSKHAVILRLLKYSLPLVFRETGGIPICVTSAKYNKGIHSFMNNAISIYNKWNSRVPTPILNRFIYDMQRIYPPPSVKQIRKHGRWVRYIRPKVRYMTQYTIRPPSFIAFCGTQIINEYYFYKLRRFLRNEFGLNGIPIRIKMRSNMDINKYNDEYMDQILQTKKKKLKNDKRKGRVRRLSMTEVLKLRKFRKQVKEFGNANNPTTDDDYNTLSERYKKSMNSMIQELEMTKEQRNFKKQQQKKLTVDRFKHTQRTKYKTYIPK